MPEAILPSSMSAGAARFDRFDSLLGSIGTWLACHRVPSWYFIVLSASCMTVGNCWCSVEL
eukprot:14932706-Alexandrium_andersonii.AAC.1